MTLLKLEAEATFREVKLKCSKLPFSFIEQT